jgi:hypothetical protein
MTEADQFIGVELSGSVVQPGDTLLIAISGQATPGEIDRMVSLLSEDLPGVRVIAIPAQQLIIYRPGV